MRRLIGSTEYVGFYHGKVFLSLPLRTCRYRTRDFSLGLTRSCPSSSSLPHPVSCSPVSPQLPAPHLLHRSISESRVLLRPDSLPAFSFAVTLHIASSFSRLRIIVHVLLPPYHGVCGLLRSARTVLARPPTPVCSLSSLWSSRLSHLRARRCVFRVFHPLSLRSSLFHSRRYRYKKVRIRRPMRSDFDGTPYRFIARNARTKVQGGHVAFSSRRNQIKK